MGRNVALGGSLAMLALLAFLTVSVIIEDGFTILVGLSLLILALVGIGALGALTGPRDD